MEPLYEPLAAVQRILLEVAQIRLKPQLREGVGHVFVAPIVNSAELVNLQQQIGVVVDVIARVGEFGHHDRHELNGLDIDVHAVDVPVLRLLRPIVVNAPKIDAVFIRVGPLYRVPILAVDGNEVFFEFGLFGVRARWERGQGPVLSLNAVDQVVHNVREKSLGHVLVCALVLLGGREDE